MAFPHFESKAIYGKAVNMVDIKGYEGLYAVTSCGKVWSYRSNKFLKLCDNGKGYLIAGLSKDGKSKMHRVNRLVAKAYIPNPNNYPQVNHRDENKTNNSVCNLEWCDNKYNLNYGTHNARMARTLSISVICVETGEIFGSISEARKAMESNNSIAKACSGECETAYGFHWNYV